MKSKLTIVLAVLLVAVFAMPKPAEAQEEGMTGYNVKRDPVMKVAQYANNAVVNDLSFKIATNENPHIPNASPGETLTIKIGYGLPITNDDAVRGDASASFTLWCPDPDAGSIDCQETANEDNPKATLSNKDGKGVITITIGSGATEFVVAGVRVDASALNLDDEIIASITSTTDANQVLLGGASSGGGVSGVVGMVAASLKVTAEKDADLACSSVSPMPSITVGEGYSMAWGPTNLEADTGGDNMQTASIKIMLDNLPDGAKVEWPGTVNSMINIAPSGADKDERVNGTLKMDAAESSSNGKVVVYNYTQVAMTASSTTDDPTTTDMDESMMAFTASQSAAARSFKIMPSKTTFMGDASVDISAMLYPMARRGTDGEKLGLDSKLSFEAEMQAPEKGNGEGWLVISECVTYLLYPFITCGATPGWSTGISVSNTTADGNIFGAFDETAEQMGSVIMYGFPKGQTMPAEGEMVEPIVAEISDNLMAGDTLTFDCGNTTMAGMEGYAIIRAGFQHARGLAFVLGNFADGAGVDVSHGYMAEVIHDPATRSDKIE